MDPSLELAARALAFGLLVTVGFDITGPALRQVGARPSLVAAGVLLPPFVLPVLAIGLIRIFDPPALLSSGLLLLSACPIGGLSNSYTFLAGASTALSVTMTAISLLSAFVTIPVATLVIERVWHFPAPYAVPAGAVARELLFVLGPPLAIGAAARARWAEYVERYRGTIQQVGLIMLAALVLLIVADSAQQPWSDFGQAVPLAVGFVVCGFTLGWSVALALGASPGDRFALAAEFATRNVPVSLAIALLLARQAEFTWFASIYLAVELPLMGCAVAGFRWMYPRPRASP